MDFSGYPNISAAIAGFGKVKETAFNKKHMLSQSSHGQVFLRRRWQSLSSRYHMELRYKRHV